MDKKELSWSVYVHIVPKNITQYDYDKYYVGITSMKPQKRWGYKGKGYKDQVFYYAIQKYGWNNIEHEIIANNLTHDEACNMETVLINILCSNIQKNGYNLTNGGEGTTGTSRTKEQINATISVTSKAVFQFDLYGNFIKDYPSVSQASRETKISDSTICNYANLKSTISGSTKYIWLYKDEVVKKNNSYYIKNIDKILFSGSYVTYQFDINGNFINRFPSPLIASKYTGINYNIIHGQLRVNNTHRTLHNYVWRYGKDVIYKNGTYKIIEKDYNRFLGVDIYQFDENKQFIAKYRNALEAERASEVSQTSILRHSEKASQVLCKKKYYFRRRKDVIESEENPGSFFMLR